MAKRHPDSPLALAVLALLRERPMHPYEMASTLRERRKEASIKLRYGSLYTVIKSLHDHDFIVARERVRIGRRPERTVFELTQAGAARLDEWMAELLAQPAKEYPRFEAALSLMPVLPPDRVAELLDARAQSLEHRIAEVEEDMATAAQEGVAELFLIEGAYEAAMLRTEQSFVTLLAARIRGGDIAGLDFWKDFHNGARPQQP
jgi:DNA-binding PadR family transcriptional regulator